MKNKCLLILPYFGKFGNYFQLFLNSVGKNDIVDLLIFTDDRTMYDYPRNVKIEYIEFEDLKTKIQDKFDFELSLSTPYKLCDYKPAYGYLFSEYLNEYSYWGHCDCDLIFGNLDRLLTPILNEGYDKVFAAGHLTIYRNTDENNRVFMSEYLRNLPYKVAFSTNKVFVFDEDMVDVQRSNVHSIFLSNNKKVYSNDLSCNISTITHYLSIASYSPDDRGFKNEKGLFRLFYDNGNVYSFSRSGNTFCRRDFIYAHLQNRRMRVKIPQNIDSFEIKPDRFVLKKEEMRKTRYLPLVLKFSGWRMFDVYFEKVKRNVPFKKKKKREFYGQL